MLYRQDLLNHNIQFVSLLKPSEWFSNLTGNVREGVCMRKIIAEYFPLLWGTFVQSEETNPDYVRAGLLCARARRPITENLHYNLEKRRYI